MIQQHSLLCFLILVYLALKEKQLLKFCGFKSDSSRCLIVFAAIALFLLPSAILSQVAFAGPTPKANPSISVVKMVSANNATWLDANSPPGLNVSVGTNVYYQFKVNNTGNVTLTCITLKDSQYSIQTLCLPKTLAPNATFTYYLGPKTAQPYQHWDTATASGKYNNKVYCATDKAYYYGTPTPNPSLRITKYVSSDGMKWSDANTPPGLIVLLGQNVTYKCVIKNTGNVALINITLEDDPVLPSTQVASSLAPCATFTYIIPPSAALFGQNSDNATASAIYNDVTYNASDTAYYYGSLCTYTACEYSNCGAAANLLKTYFNTTFPQGLEIGYYANITGYGYNWTDVNSLKQVLKSIGTSGAITADILNPRNLTHGGGKLAVQTATLTLNIAFGEQALKCMPSGLAALIYNKTGDALNGKTVSEILAIANDVLGGQLLPAGYTYDSLACLLANINGAYDNCAPSCWARTYLVMQPT